MNERRVCVKNTHRHFPPLKVRGIHHVVTINTDTYHGGVDQLPLDALLAGFPGELFLNSFESFFLNLTIIFSSAEPISRLGFTRL